MSDFCLRAPLLSVYRGLTCNALPPPPFLAEPARAPAKAATWADMEAALVRTGQAHVLTPPPPADKKAAFLAQLQSVDLDALPGMLQTSLKGAEARAVKRTPFAGVVTLEDLPEKEVAGLRADGLSMVARGEVACLLLAGGQGTRLGTSAPKGTYNIGLPSGKSLFQYHAEKLRKVKRLAASHAGVRELDVRMRLLVMTSAATDAPTRAFFAEHDFFGLGAGGVTFFEQGMLPCVTPEGKLLLEAPGELAMAPNGNGGCYMSLRDSGLLRELDAQGVTSVFQFGVDNILCHVADPTFLGFCAKQKADCAMKTVPKAHAHEAVGALALADGKPAVVEYSEISKEMAEATDAATGRLSYGSAHICVNFFSVPFLRHFCEAKLATLPLHVAHKKIPHVGPSGAKVSPTAPNGIKLELFIFDTFPHAKRMAALEVPRDDEFAPVKNAPGSKSDSPDTARALIYSLSLRRLQAAGAEISAAGSPAAKAGGTGAKSGAGGGSGSSPKGASGLLQRIKGLAGSPSTPKAEVAPDGVSHPVVEISPLLSYQGEGLEHVRGQTLKPPVLLADSVD